MTLAELRAALAALAEERSGITDAAAGERGEGVDVLGLFVRDAEGNDTDERTAAELIGLTADEAERWAAIEGEELQLQAQLERAQRVQRQAERVGSISTDSLQVMSGADPTDFERAMTADLGELRSMRRSMLESMRGVDADTLEAIEGTLALIGDAGAHQERAATQYAIAHGSDAYRSAFHAVLTGRAGQGRLTDDERQALAWADQARAAITTGTGLAFPINIDPQMVRTGVAEFSPFRSVATVRSGTAISHSVNTLGNTSFSMANDGTEVTDGTPGDDSVTIVSQIAHGVTQWSIAAAEDMAGLEADLRNNSARGMANLETAQFTNGTGVAPQVEGILDGSTIARVTTGTATKLRESDLIGALNAVPDIWQRGASWMMSQGAANSLRVLEDTGGSRLWSSIGDSPAEGSRPTGLLGLPTRVNSLMADPSTGIDTFTAGDDVAIVGNLAEAYRIYDRIGMMVEPIPLMMGTAANLPNGTRGLYMRWRFGAGIVNANAARVIDIG